MFLIKIKENIYLTEIFGLPETLLSKKATSYNFNLLLLEQDLHHLCYLILNALDSSHFQISEKSVLTALRLFPKEPNQSSSHY